MITVELSLFFLPYVKRQAPTGPYFNYFYFLTIFLTCPGLEQCTNYSNSTTVIVSFCFVIFPYINSKIWQKVYRSSISYDIHGSKLKNGSVKVVDIRYCRDPVLGFTLILVGKPKLSITMGLPTAAWPSNLIILEMNIINNQMNYIFLGVQWEYKEQFWKSHLEEHHKSNELNARNS